MKLICPCRSGHKYIRREDPYGALDKRSNIVKETKTNQKGTTKDQQNPT
uniref:Uncharacterized protein n=1 Tax=Anguilla anguilla TaxID=7936 RepID=A0A0E9TSG1_ANGAN